MIYKTPYDASYHFKKNYPMVALFFVLLTMFGLIYSPYLSAGDTMFKECKHCGHLNYQFSNTCSMCGTTGRFEDVYLLPDCEKRDAKKKKKAKCIRIADNVEAMNDLYDQHITPVEILIYQFSHQHKESYDELIPMLKSIREFLIDKYNLQQYRRPLYSGDPN